MHRLQYTLFSIFLAGTLLLAACSFTSGTGPTATTVAAATSAQATIQSAAPTAPPPTSPPIPSATPNPTATLAPTQPPQPTATTAPTETTTPTAAASPTSASTAVPAGATAHVDQATYCRKEPSPTSSSIFIAQAGSDLPIVSQTSLKNYVIVQNPNNTAQTCWLWTQYVTINGSITGLPLVTPPPVTIQDVDFVVSFFRVEVCRSAWMPGFTVVNTGLKTLDSSRIRIKDDATKTTRIQPNNYFDLRSGCSVEKNVPEIANGQIGFVFSEPFSYDPTGSELAVTVTLCTEDGLGGTCKTKSFTITP